MLSWSDLLKLFAEQAGQNFASGIKQKDKFGQFVEFPVFCLLTQLTVVFKTAEKGLIFYIIATCTNLEVYGYMLFLHVTCPIWKRVYIAVKILTSVLCLQILEELC